MVGGLHRWFESMRVPGGYGGPVGHWWRHSLQYTGPGLDWRYEGIIHGYLNLYEATGRAEWLEVAMRAGDDLVAGQLPSGNYRASAFERNPEVGGTPHEACASGALLRLARVCRDAGRDWEAVASAATRNLQWHLDALWRADEATFSDTVGLDSFVPNKIASTVAALLEYVRLSGDETILDQFVTPAAETILDLQVDSGEHRGAIHQLWAKGSGERGDGKFLPLYIARCIPPLLAVADVTGAERFERAAIAAGDFLRRVEHEDGSFPQVVYASGNRNGYPRWIAGVGDLLRAYDALNARGHAYETGRVASWLRSGVDECGALQTAEGFGRVTGHDGSVFADVVHVVGWNDKAFRWLTTQVDRVDDGDVNRSGTRCTFEGTPGRFVEDADRIEFVPRGRSERTYRWDKTSTWADVA